MVRNEAGVITEVDDSISCLLGWRPEQLIGTPSTALIHPNDQTSGISAWFAMTKGPQSTRKWRGRYSTVEGKWRWIETINTNRLDDPDRPCVLTLMQPASADYVSVEEELRGTEELISSSVRCATRWDLPGRRRSPRPVHQRSPSPDLGQSPFW